MATRPTNRRLLPLLVIAVAIAMTVATAGLLRHELLVAWYCHKIENSGSFEDATEWAERLWSEPGRKAKLRIAARRMGTGSGKLDYTLIKFAMWPNHNEWHAGIREWPQKLQKSKLSEMSDYLDVLLDETASRPKLLDLYIHERRFHLHSVGIDKAYVLGGEFLLFPEAIGLPEPDSEWEPVASRMMDLAVQCRLSGRDDLLTGLTKENWKERADEWQEWLSESIGFLRFDESRARCVLDDQAKENGDELPEDAHWMTASSDHLPGWLPPPGWSPHRVWDDYTDSGR